MADNNGINTRPAMASNGVQHLDAVLAIDIGSTETRVVIAWHDGANIQKRIIENRADTHTPLNTLAQFSTRVLVHDDEPVKYIGNDIQLHREESSAKFIPYILTGKNEKFNEQYLILGRLWDERDKTRGDPFHERLEEAFNQFLCFVLKATKGALETYSSNNKQIRIKTVAMTIPSQWDLNFEELYRRLFKRAFLQTFNDTPRVAAHDFVVVFHTEATALAHYIFHESSHEDALGGGMPLIRTILSKPNAQCLIDCGGHNANSTLTQFHPNKHGQAVLYELGKAQGAGGGSEMWIYDVVNGLIAQYRLVYNDHDVTELPQWFYQRLKRDTTAKLAMATGEASELVVCEHPRGLDRRIVLEITKEMREKAFQTGFKYVKAMIESQLRELASISQGWRATDHIITVIVSGGSSMHPEFIKWIRALCTKLGLPAPLFTKVMEIHNGPVRIALGAAYASLTSESVASFAEKCAFGLQKGKVENQGGDDEHLVLEGSAATIWYQEQGVVPRTVDARGDQAEYRIVCEPFLESYKAVLPTDRNMARGASYDFLNIGILPDGYRHRVEFELNDKEEQVELKIYRIPNPPSGKLKKYARPAAKREKVLSLGPFPVHVQPGTRCLVIQQSTDEIDEQITNAMEDYRDDPGKDDTDRDETWRGGTRRDATRRDDTDSDDTDSDDNYPDDADNAVIPGGDHSSLSSGLHHSHRAQGPSSGTSSSHGLGYTGGGSTNAAFATDASTSTSKTSSLGGGRIASKTDTARAASSAFRPSREVSGRAASNGQTGLGVSRGTLTSTLISRPGEDTRYPRIENGSSTGDGSSSDDMGSLSMAPGSHGNASGRNKRPAPTEDNNRRPTKRNRTSGEPSSAAADHLRQRASRAEPSRDPVTSYSAAFENRRSPPAMSRNGDYYRPSADSNRFPGLDAPSRRPAGLHEYSFSDRYRDRESESSVHHSMAVLNLNHNVSASSSRPRDPAPAHPAHRRDTTAPWTPRAGNPGFSSRSAPVESPRQASNSRSARNSGPAGSSQHRRGFRGWGPANRGGHPRRSD